MTDLRKLCWLYLILLIFEGALRKWIIPALDAPLLLIRDPLVLWIYFQAARRGLSFNNPISNGALILGVVTGLISLVVGVSGSLTPLITVYGFRTDFLQIPLIFLLPQILDRDDVLAMGKFLLWLTLPMVIIEIAQFRSPPDSLINKGTMATHYETVRPSGTFSFGTGLSAYFAFCSAFILYGFIHLKTYKYWLLGMAIFSSLLAIACSGSRGCLVAIGIVVAIAVLCAVTRGKGGMGLLVGGAIIAIAFAIVSSTSVAEEGMTQLNRRIDDAGAVENGLGGFVMRYVDTVIGPMDQLSTVPFLGFGLGLGTNAGLGLYHGKVVLDWPEQEWERLIFESGPMLGFVVIIMRIVLTVTLAMRAFAAYRNDNILPALLFGVCAVPVFNGQWGVPTTLGFAIFVAGLTLAACVEPPDWEEDEEYADDEEENETGEYLDDDDADEFEHPHDQIR